MIAFDFLSKLGSSSKAVIFKPKPNQTRKKALEAIFLNLILGPRKLFFRLCSYQKTIPLKVTNFEAITQLTKI